MGLSGYFSKTNQGLQVCLRFSSSLHEVFNNFGGYENDVYGNAASAFSNR